MNQKSNVIPITFSQKCSSENCNNPAMYTVSFKTGSYCHNCIKLIDAQLHVKQLQLEAKLHYRQAMIVYFAMIAIFVLLLIKSL